MKNRHSCNFLALGLGLTLVLLWLVKSPSMGLPISRAAGPWYVAPGGDDGDDCLSTATPCVTINGAIAKASPGDMVYVAIGTYTGNDGDDEVVRLDKDVILSGGWEFGAIVLQSGISTIDGEVLRPGITVNNNITTTVDHFAVQNGYTYGDGGGIYNSGTLTLTNSIIRGNTANGNSGGIYNGGTLTVNNSAISGNTANDGSGGIHNEFGTVTLNGSIVSNNVGGGISSNYGVVTLNNSSVSDNMGGGIGGGTTVILNNTTVSGNTGTGVSNWYGNVTLNSSTVSGNSGNEGGGISVEAAILQNTIVAGNTAGSGPDCLGAFDSAGYNLIGDTSGCDFTPSTGDLTGASANLGQLIGVPGVPKYRPLLSGSPAIDAGNPAGCTGSTGPLTTDQRGASRVGRCDIGAYEYTTPGPATAIYASGGTLQHAPPSTAFGTPFQAGVVDSIGSPVDSATVTFFAPESGTSGTFADTGTFTTTAVTGESGVATASTFTANELIGSYTVTATVSGVATPTHFLLHNGFWYVASDGNDDNSCLNATAACATINGVLGKSGFIVGDTVLVATGTYTGASDEEEEVVLLNKSVSLSGGWDDTFTIQSGASTIDGEGSRLGITVKGDVTAILERFTVQSGSSDGIRNWNGNVILNDSTINDTRDGHGINNMGTLTLNNSSVSNTRSRYGSGISNNGALVLNNSTVSGNVTDQHGGGIYNEGTLTLNNSTISRNTANDEGGGVCSWGGDVTLNNSTVSGNTASTGGGIYTNNASAILQNTIVAGNTASSAPDCWGDLGSSGYNLIGSTSGCTFTLEMGDLTNVSANLGELIGASETPRYHPLLSGSPAIDAGNPTGCTGSTGSLATDQRGASRVGRCDIGAYEYTTPGPATVIYAFGGTPQRTPPSSAFETPLQAIVFDSIGSPVGSTLVTFFAPESGASGTFADTGTFMMTAVTNESGVTAEATFTANGLVGSYTVTATASGIATPTHFLLRNIEWYVLPGGDDADDCQSPTTACLTINGALNKSGFAAGDTVRVGIGMYTGAGDEVVLLDKDVILSGGWEWDRTLALQSGASIIDGENSRRGITVNSDATVMIERFTVQNGSTPDGGGGIYNDGDSILTLNNSTIIGNVDGGIENGSTLTLNNSVVSGNTGGEGGGISNGNDGILTLNNSTISSNVANVHGGGLFNRGTLTLNNSAVTGNKADVYSSGDGGGIANGGTMALNNSTISDNTASGRGGGINNGGYTALNNSTVARNSAVEGGGVSGYFGINVTLQNSILFDNTARNGPDCFDLIVSASYNLIGDTSDCTFLANIGDLLDVDAMLFSLTGSPGYHPLLPGSPAIDAGNPAGCTDHLGASLDTDQRGVARVGRCDIGAYEFDPANDPLTHVFLPVVTRNYCAPLYTDDFSDPGSGWPISDDGDIQYEYLDGEYRILVRNTNRWAGAAPGFKASDYVVTVDVRNVTGLYGSYGLTFGLSNDWSQFYSLEIDPDGNYGIMRYGSGTWTNLATGTSGSINTGTSTNTLKIEHNGSLIQAYANGQLLTSVSDSTYGGSRRIGLVVSTYSLSNVDARFDDFTVYPVGCGADASASSHVNKAPSGGAEERNLPSKWTSGPTHRSD